MGVEYKRRTSSCEEEESNPSNIRRIMYLMRECKKQRGISDYELMKDKIDWICVRNKLTKLWPKTVSVIDTLKIGSRGEAEMSVSKDRAGPRPNSPEISRFVSTILALSLIHI